MTSKIIAPTVKSDNKHVYADSRDVAEYFGKRHGDVIRAIKALEKDHSEQFIRRSFASKTWLDSKGREQPFYEMSQNGFFRLISKLSGKLASLLVEKYIAEFDRMSAALQSVTIARSKASWIEERAESKVVRRTITDTIRDVLLPEIIRQCEASGETSSYIIEDATNSPYMTYSRMLHAELGIKWDTRDDLSEDGLRAVRDIEDTTRDIIEEECECGTEYHEIFRLCKESAGYHVKAKRLGRKTLTITRQADMFTALH